MTEIGYYISTIPQPRGGLVCAEENKHLILSTTPIGSLVQLRHLILAEAHPLLVLRGYMVGLRCAATYPIVGEPENALNRVQVRRMQPTVDPERQLVAAADPPVGVGAGHDFAAYSGVVASCRRLEDSVGSGYQSLLRLRELATMHWRRPVHRTPSEWLSYYLRAGWRSQSRNIALLWQQHITQLVVALGGDTIITAGQPVAVEGYTKAIELAYNRLSSNLCEDERSIMDAMFDCTCALLGRRFAALGHRYHEGVGLVTIMAVATAVAALVTTASEADDAGKAAHIIELVPPPASAAPLHHAQVACFVPLFEMLKAGGVAAVYSGVGGGMARLAGLPIGSTLVERVKVAAYYAH